jgi:photosystem II stability/assembly factor-like uncharacterized protein
MKLKSFFISVFIFLLITVFNINVYSQWVTSGTISNTITYPGVSVVNQNVAWISGGATTPFIYRTTDGGATWVSLPTNGLQAKALMCLWAIDSLTCYVADGGDAAGATGGDATLSKTTNGGQNWTAVFNTGGTTGFFNGIVFSRINPLIGVAESDPPNGTGGAFYLQKTTNGGVNWTLTNPTAVGGTTASGQNSVFIIDNLFYGFGLNNAATARITSDGGATWFSGALGLTGTFTSAIAFQENKQVGIAATGTSYPNVARTTNGGTSWSTVNTGGTGTGVLFSALKWVNGTNTVYYLQQSTTTGLILKSTNAGLNWTSMTAPQDSLFHFDFVRIGTNVTGFAASTNGHILKLTETVTEISSENNIIPAEYKLEQNYPNPFNPTTTIKYAIPKSSFVTINIYDVTGKNIETLVSENKIAGNYDVNFNAAKYSSGVYFYTIRADSYTDTKKMMLIK